MSEAFYDWNTSAGRQPAGEIRNLGDLAEWAVWLDLKPGSRLAQLLETDRCPYPGQLEQELAQAMLQANDALSDEARQGAEDLLYLLLARPDGAKELVIAEEDDAEDGADEPRPPSILDRAGAVRERWGGLSQRQRARELLLVYFHQFLKLTPPLEDPLRNEKIGVLLEQLLEHPEE